MLIYENSYLQLVQEQDQVLMKVTKSGFHLKEMDLILRLFPRIKLTNFSLLKTILNNPNEKFHQIGIWLPLLELEVARDRMSASIFIYETNSYIRENQQQLLIEIKQLLKMNKIIYGVIEINLESVESGKATLIAKGTPPQQGADAIVKYVELPDRKPIIEDDGRANYFDMNFLIEMKEGSWLGEKIAPTEGVAGRDIYGHYIPAKPGNDANLLFDPRSAYVIEKKGKTVIRSKISGVVEMVNGVLGLSALLVIEGDVGVESGNIDYQGAVMIRGTVLPGYSVRAKGDIAIESSEGVSGADKIISQSGDIYIRGGVFGLGQTQVEAGGTIFIKHINDATVVACGDLHIGFYSLSANLQAHSIYLNEQTGRIIGGKAIAKNVISTATSGNYLERRTELIIQGINKNQAKFEIQNKASYLKTLREETLDLQTQVDRIKPLEKSLNGRQIVAYEQAKQKLVKNNELALMADCEIKQMMEELRNAGCEEIIVTKEAFPGTYIQIGKKSTTLSKLTNGKFLMESGELNI